MQSEPQRALSAGVLRMQLGGCHLECSQGRAGVVGGVQRGSFLMQESGEGAGGGQDHSVFLE